MHRWITLTESVPADDILSTYDEVEKVSGWINQYGFMIVFSSVVLVLVVAIVLIYSKIYAKKESSEVELLHKERIASIEQNQKMFDLVTNVQTEQVFQLQQMTQTLRDINHDVILTSDKIQRVTDDYDTISHNMLECKAKNDTIVSTVGEILDYTRNNSKCTKEILSRVIKLEEMLSSQDK